MVGEWIVLNSVLNSGDWIPGTKPFDLQGYVKRMKAISEKFDAFYNYVIADHVEKKKLAGKNFIPKDMVDVLLQLTEDDANPETKLTIESVKTLVHDLMPGGTDTSTVTIEWAIHELLKNQRVLAKLREELDSIIGRDRWVEEKDASNLPYLNAIVKETLRLHALSPLLAPHYALDDCKVAGYDTLKNTVVLINAWSIGRRPDCWDDPYDFRPERFLEGKEYGLNGQSFSLLPFGSDRRRCPGYGFALKLVPTTIANVLHGFNWKFIDGMKSDNLCMVERYGLTTCPEILVSVVPET